VAQAMIEEIPLPSNACNLGRNPFVIANQFAKRCLSIDAEEGVQMIWHEQQQIEIPSRSVMVNARCVR